MRRGTTPIHTFIPDIDLTGMEVLFITYVQDGKTVLEKTIEDTTYDGEKITVSFTQEDTLAFHTAKRVEIQIRARFPDGSAVASNILNVPVERILKEGEI